ncbi:uncharacterized protein N7515_000588 [Penicillium bovifimosum]|uniref:Inositol polyphosphate-related phosphatase domain-containing protein n=1 Tax=Penicillium bovifimosum TaxID=126998 RepID=A0A9W9HFC2_9EURO|nr:uncharacterized protein N7515_000588 [Penicillium bovifimosum]KAJ5146024.1 hypothetical protein N7515_000588 [Penicillium bovifimosum]
MSHKSKSSTDHHAHEQEYAEEAKNPGLDVLSLSRAVKARKSEYTGRRSIRVKVGTWNVAAISGTEKDIGKWFVCGQGVCEKLEGVKGIPPEHHAPETHGESESAGDKTAPFHYSPEDIDLYVLGLQEVVDVSSPAEALRPYVDPGPSQRWKEAVDEALPSGYELVSEVQLVGLLLLIYASPSIGSGISYISSTSVGTGLMGYMGNKGAVATRLVLGETTRLVFINSHLAAGSDKNSLERRNWDSSQIVQRAKFEPISFENDASEDLGDSIGDEDFTFWFGDLNYRLEDIPGEDVRQVLARHTANPYDNERYAKRDSNHSGVSGDSTADSGDDSPPPSVQDGWAPDTDDESDPHNDPASLQTTISSLLPHDQLRIQQTKGTAFHKGWREGPISFLPTYKYDVGSVAMFDSSEKQRGPSWCDRILFRTHQDKVRHELLDREAEEARKRDKDMTASGIDKAVADDNVLFEYNPDTDGAESEYSSDEGQSDDEGDTSTVASQELSHDPIRLDQYVSYQGIVSSDHKPLAATFTLGFNAVNPELKAKIHQEVARELDRAENEARPNLTVVVDRHRDQPVSKDPDGLEFGDVAFDVPVHRSLTIANTSGTAATFSFAKRHGDADDTIAQAPSWLLVSVFKSPNAAGEDRRTVTATPGRHTLYPGEVANVDVTAHVKSVQHIRLLNIGKLKLEDILILHVDGGRDHFISVHGRWLPTCFGCSIEELTRMPEGGARSLSESQTPHPSGTDGPAEVRLSAPRELFRLTEAISELTERAIAEWSMTNGENDEHKAPWKTEVSAGAWPFEPETWTLKDPQERASLRASVHEALDTNSSFDTIFAPEVPSLHRLEILCETLLAFLNALEDGIVTAKVWHEMEQQITAREKSKAPPLTWEETQAWVLEHLAYSPAHSVSFTFVTFMLARIANEVAPVPSTKSPLSSGQAPANKQHKENIDPSHPPSPVSATSFITSGSFRRKNRHSGSSTSTSPDPAAQNPSLVRRQEIETALASIFSRVLISANAPLPSKDKERRIAEERRRSIIEPFLKMVGVDDRGPSGGRS